MTEQDIGMWAAQNPWPLVALVGMLLAFVCVAWSSQ